MKSVAPAFAGFLVATAVVIGGAAPASAAAASPTFAKDVAPILQAHCQVCHRAGSIAPMSLMTYDEVRPWARAMKTRVGNRSMPPWMVERHIGIEKFKEDQSLSDKDV